jgi:pilus assembly protein Flp/PilA
MTNLYTSLQSHFLALQARMESDERGAAAVEYALLVSLIAIAIIAAVVALSGSLSGAFNSVSDHIKNGK